MKPTKVAIYILLCVVWSYSALPDTTEEHLDRAREMMSAGNYKKAADEFRAVVRLATDDSIMAQNATYWVGQCYLKMKQYDDALLTFERIVEDYPESALVSVTRAMMDRVRQEKADEEFRARMDAASGKGVIVDQKTGLTYTRIFSGDKLNLLSHNRGLQISTDGRFLFDYLGHWIIPLKDGQEPFHLGSDVVDVFFGSWSPDMSAFAYIAQGTKDLFVVPISPDTGRPTGPAKRLVKGETGKNIKGNFMLSWSPDGREIAFPLLRDGNVDVWTISAAGGEPVRITDDPLEERRPVWSPDGRSIVFARKRDFSGERRWNILTVAARGGSPQEMMEDAYTYGFSPDGEWFAFARIGEEGIYVMRLKDKRQFHIEPPEIVVGGFSSGPKACWASKGSKLLFYNSGFEYWATMGLVLPYGGPPVELGKGCRFGSWVQDWSPDGKYILTLDWEAHDLWVVPTDGEAPERIEVKTQPEIWRYAVQPFSPDLRKAAFVTEDGTLWVFPISIDERRVTGPAMKIAEEIRGPRTTDIGWSPDSKWLVFSSLKGGNADVWIASADGKELKQVTSEPEEESISGWRDGSAWSSEGGYDTIQESGRCLGSSRIRR